MKYPGASKTIVPPTKDKLADRRSVDFQKRPLFHNICRFLLSGFRLCKRQLDRMLPSTRSFHDFPFASGVLDSGCHGVRAGSASRHGKDSRPSNARERENGCAPHTRPHQDGVACKRLARAIALGPRTAELSLLLPRRLSLVRGLFFRTASFIMSTQA